jgi:hypothetical protein
MTVPSIRCISCKHYKRGELFNEIDNDKKFIEGDFLPVCKAFPSGIPDEITDETNKHDKPLKDQNNDLVYTPK